MAARGGKVKFRTEISCDSPGFKIFPSDKIMTVGSCFASSMGLRFESLRFRTLVNPFGVLYNPVTIKNAILRLKEKKEVSAEELVLHQGEYHGFDFHSDFSSENEASALGKMNSGIESGSKFLNEADILIVTLGTAFVYNYKKLNRIVSNCHKIPESEFERRMLSPKEVEDNVNEIIKAALECNPSIKLIFTLSPIRHIRDGLHQNNLSKASLLLGLQAALVNLGYQGYFPAYEIMLDDLRDYRFYGKDLVHPSDEAVDYIWEQFEGMYFSGEASEAAKDFQRLLAAESHRLRNKKSPEYQKFKAKLNSYISVLEKKYPYLSFEKDRDIFGQL